MGNVVRLNQYKHEKMYEANGAACINLALDNVTRKQVKRDIKREMIKSYMKLLSNK